MSASGVPTQIVTLEQNQEVASVSEQDSKGITIFPNPARGVFSILVDKAKYPDMKVSITDANGSLVLSRECKGEAEYLFDMGTSPQGTYYVKVKTENEILVTKLVVIK